MAGRAQTQKSKKVEKVKPAGLPPKRSAKTAKKGAKVAAKVAPKSASKEPVESLVGKHMPRFTMAVTGGGSISNEELHGKKVVLYFYPKDNTPGCTLEGQDFTKFSGDFSKANTVIFGISKDSVQTHEGFKAKLKFKHELIADTNGEMCEKFGVWRKKQLYGREFMGIVRSTFLIDEEGVIREEWRGVKVPGHVEAVLKAAKALA